MVQNFRPANIISWEERHRARMRREFWCDFFVRLGIGMLIAGVVLGALVIAGAAHATWKPQYADASPAVRDWYEHAQLTQAAQKRFGFASCCAHADVVRTQFRVGVKGDDVWEFWDQSAAPPGWQEIPADIIHWNEEAPDGQATLFRMGGDGALTCFFPPQSGN